MVFIMPTMFCISSAERGPGFLAALGGMVVVRKKEGT